MRNNHALVAFLESREDWLFGYGEAAKTHDCARFFAAGIEAVTGKNPLADFTGTWTTELGAARVLARHGGMAAAVSSVLAEIDPNFAQRGDGGMTATGALVLFEGVTVVGLNEADGRGYNRLPRSAVVTAWSAE